MQNKKKHADSKIFFLFLKLNILLGFGLLKIPVKCLNSVRQQLSIKESQSSRKENLKYILECTLRNSLCECDGFDFLIK